METAKGPSFRRLIGHPGLLDLYDYWLARLEASGCMLRADLEPLDLPQILPNLILSDVNDGGRAIRYRLVGTGIATAHGFDYTGKTVEELTSGSTLDFTRTLYGRIVGEVIPVYSEGHFRWAGKEYRWTHRLHLPLSRNGDIVDMVLAGQFFSETRPGGPESVIAATRAQIDHDRGLVLR